MNRFYIGKTSNQVARSTAQPNRKVLDEYRRYYVKYEGGEYL